MSEWTTMHNGVSLRDLFALRAPTEPCQTFTPIMPHPRPEFPKDMEFCEGCKDDCECLRPHTCGQLREIQRKQREYREEWNVQRWAQWPWHWADQILAKRGAVEE